MEVSGQLHAPAALPPGKEPLVPIRYEAGWAPEPFWTRWFKEKFSAPAGNRTPIVQPVAQRYTDWAITALGVLGEWRYSSMHSFKYGIETYINKLHSLFTSPETLSPVYKTSINDVFVSLLKRDLSHRTYHTRRWVLNGIQMTQIYWQFLTLTRFQNLK
jgi:hypothetical protein